MPRDNKTIGITLRFWTNDLPERVGSKLAGTPFWTSGVVLLEANKTKGISSQSQIFHYIDDIPRAIKEVMKKAKLVPVEDLSYSDRAKKRNK